MSPRGVPGCSLGAGVAGALLNNLYTGQCVNNLIRLVISRVRMRFPVIMSSRSGTYVVSFRSVALMLAPRAPSLSDTVCCVSACCLVCLVFGVGLRGACLSMFSGGIRGVPGVVLSRERVEDVAG